MSDYQKIEILFMVLKFLGLFIIFVFGYYEWIDRFQISKQNEVAKNLLVTFIKYKEEIQFLRFQHSSRHTEKILASREILRDDLSEIMKLFCIQKKVFLERWDKFLEVDTDLEIATLEAKIVLGIDFKDFQNQLMDVAMKLYSALIDMEDCIVKYGKEELQKEYFEKRFKENKAILGMITITEDEKDEIGDKVNRSISEVCENLEPFLAIRTSHRILEKLKETFKS